MFLHSYIISVTHDPSGSVCLEILSAVVTAGVHGLNHTVSDVEQVDVLHVLDLAKHDDQLLEL